MPARLYHEASGEGPPLVLIHGLFGNGNNLKQLAQRLCERYRILLPDLRNHGRSEWAEPMDYPSIVDDLWAWLDSEGHKNVSIAGHSMGGKVAMAMALAQPQRVQLLCVLDIAPGLYPVRHQKEVDGMKSMPLTWIKTRAQADAWLTNFVPQPPVRQFLMQNLVRDESVPSGWCWRLNVSTMQKALPTLAQFPDMMPSYKGPALFLHGARSDYVTAEREPDIRRCFPQAVIQTISDADHWLHVQKPDEVAAAILNVNSDTGNPSP